MQPDPSWTTNPIPTLLDLVTIMDRDPSIAVSHEKISPVRVNFYFALPHHANLIWVIIDGLLQIMPSLRNVA